MDLPLFFLLLFLHRFIALQWVLPDLLSSVVVERRDSVGLWILLEGGVPADGEGEVVQSSGRNVGEETALAGRGESRGCAVVDVLPFYYPAH